MKIFTRSSLGSGQSFSGGGLRLENAIETVLLCYLLIFPGENRFAKAQFALSVNHGVWSPCPILLDWRAGQKEKEWRKVCVAPQSHPLRPLGL